MAVTLGNNYRLWIESTTADVYNEILGQRGVERTRSSETIDVGDKNSSPYALTAPGTFALTISAEGIVNVPDTNGLERLNTQFLAQTVTKFQIRKDGSAGATPADVEFEGLCYILELSISSPRNDARTWSVSLGLAAAPTIDTVL